MRKTYIRYSVNESYFDIIDTEDKAYFLGLMASDGCITDGNKMLIGLQREDEYILNLFKEKLQYEGPIYQIKGQTERHKEHSRLQIRNSSIYKALDEKGLTPRKSLTLKFPTIEENLKPAFIRGYFDGDGSTKIAKGVLHFRFVGTYEFLEKLQNILMENCDLPKVKMYQANKEKNTFELTYGGDRQCIRIYDYMYKNSTIFLIRKKEKARQQISDRLTLYSSYILEEELQNRKGMFVPHFINL